MLSKTLLIVAALALSVAAGPNTEEEKAAAKAAAKTCQDAYGMYNRKAKACNMDNAAAKEACLTATPPGKWIGKEATCKVRTTSPKKACEAKYGEYNKVTKICNMDNAVAKEACLTAATASQWIKARGDNAAKCKEGVKGGDRKRRAEQDEKDARAATRKAAAKAAAKTCEDAYGMYNRKAKACNMDNAAAKEACLTATPPGKWIGKEATCKVRTIPPFKACKAKYGEWNKVNNVCNMDNAVAKEACLTAATASQWINKAAKCKEGVKGGNKPTTQP